MKHSKLLSFLLSAAMLFSLTACVRPNENPPIESTPVASDPLPVPSTPAEEDSVRLAVLNGSFAVGAVKLLSDIDAGSSTQAYTYEIVHTNDQAITMLTQGTADIAALSSGAALKLYNESGGAVTVIALNTPAAMQILEGTGGSSIRFLPNLAGKTLLIPDRGSGSEHILRYLLSRNDLDPSSDVIWEFCTDDAEAAAKLISGEADCALLSVPAVSTCISQSEGKVRSALDLTQEWNDLHKGSQLITDAVVVRTEFLEKNPHAVDAFLSDYTASVSYVQSSENAAQLVSHYGITPDAATAAEVISRCGSAYITGGEMQPAIDGYYAILFESDPASIGGSRPDDGFYYVP